MTQERGKSPRRKPGGSTPKNCGEAFLGNNSAQRNLAADGAMQTDSPFPCLAPRTRTWKTLIKGQLGGSCMTGEVLTLPLVVSASVPSHSHGRVSNLSEEQHPGDAMMLLANPAEFLPQLLPMDSTRPSVRRQHGFRNVETGPGLPSSRGQTTHHSLCGKDWGESEDDVSEGENVEERASACGTRAPTWCTVDGGSLRQGGGVVPVGRA